jgi:hypothetical protein
MPIPISTDPISVVINSAALLVAIVQLYIAWGQRTWRRENRLHEVVDGNEVDKEVRRQRSRSACNAY